MSEERGEREEEIKSLQEIGVKSEAILHIFCSFCKYGKHRYNAYPFICIIFIKHGIFSTQFLYTKTAALWDRFLQKKRIK